MYKTAEMALWQGRVNEEENDDGTAALLWHQKVQGISDHLPPGFALLGFACDEGVRRNKGRPGAASGPDAIRSSLANVAWHQDRVYDAGNVVCQNPDLESAQIEFSAQVQFLLDKGHFPLGLGGGHEMAYGTFLGLAQHLSTTNSAPAIGIINLDAHFDLRDDCKGASSGTPFFQIARYCRHKNMRFHYCCLGISQLSNTAALFERAEHWGVSFLLDEALGVHDLSKAVSFINDFIHRCDVLYLTIDMDVFPASLVPGVSAPATRGVPLEVVERLIEVIKQANKKGKPKLCIADLAEYNPKFDIDGRGARIAARLVYLITRPLRQ